MTAFRFTGIPEGIAKRTRTALALLALGLAPAAAAGQDATGDSTVYVLSPASQLEVKTGKAGLLGFAGHDHVIRARAFSGRIVYYPAAPEASHVVMTIAADGLEVLTPPDTAEIRKVTAAMRTEVLEIATYPEIRFAADSVVLLGDTVALRGALTLKDRTREVPVRARVELGPDTLRATATFTVRQTDFGIRPYRGGPLGTVRVADEIRFTIRAVAIRASPPGR
ncbi:MAG: YceI family protein [Gemmatimonadales bacterium]